MILNILMSETLGWNRAVEFVHLTPMKNVSFVGVFLCGTDRRQNQRTAQRKDENMKIIIENQEFNFDGIMTAYDALKETGKISRDVLAVSINGKTTALTAELKEGDIVYPLTFADEDGRKVFHHTASHILAQAVKRLYPNAKLTIGPAIDNGFYYDFDLEEPLGQEQLSKIEKEMKKIVSENLRIERFVLSKEEALKLVTDMNEPYKALLIERISESEEISFYRQGEFVDLCAGPHLFSTAAVKAFKLTSCTGAYWEGNSNNKMLKRIYGTAFPTKDELTAFLAQQEEARKRDHNKLGRELEYFTTSEVVGQGLPIILPKGATVIRILQRFVEDEETKRGWQPTKTPFMAKSDLYKISGHWDHYLDGMFVLGNPDDKECMALRPMTCPFQYQAYLNKARSYRDLPLRYNETSTLFRNEASGEMHGLIRVRQFTISEGHLMCTPEQLETEFRSCLELAVFMLKSIGLYEDASYRFSQWDPNNREKYIGTDEQWDEAQSIMKRILDHLEIPYKIGIGEAAFYGPKLDIQIKNVFGKEDTLITIQVDQLLAAQFGMVYVDKDGQKKTPVIIHRTSIGCYERTLAYLIEKYAGALPLWMAPTQVKILPIGLDQHEYAEKVVGALRAKGMRVELDEREEKIGYKIREAQLQKVPYMLVLGAKEAEEGTVAVRDRKVGDAGAMTLEAFIAKATEEIENKVNN